MMSLGSDCPAHLQQHVWKQVQTLYCSQTQPYELLIADYMGCLQRNRELEVRVGVLDKEAAELRDEVSALNTRLAAFDELAARDFATKAEHYKSELQRANSELTSLLRDKSKAYEELLSLQRQIDSLKQAQEEAAESAELTAAEISGLKTRLAELSKQLDEEKQARALAAAEAEARVAAKAAAEAEAGRLKADNQALDVTIKHMMAKEAERLEQINRMHEEMMENAKRQQVEAGAASQLLGLLTRRRSSAAASTSGEASAANSRRSSQNDTLLQTATSAASTASPSAAAAGGNHGQLMWASLKQKMGLPDAFVEPLQERELPSAPTKRIQAHTGGCCSLAFQRPGHLVATCGLDKTVQTWDLNLSMHVSTYHGLLGSVNDVSFTSDSRHVVGAGSDKRLLVWNTATGQVVHTLTGHSNGVSCVSCSPLDEQMAASAGEDRCLKVWDLARGYSTRSLPCTKMPTALCLSPDGSTLITGHLDGTLCLWDLRQNRAGSQPLAEVRDHSQAILCLSPTSHSDRLLTASKDHQLRVWDFRQLGAVQVTVCRHDSLMVR
eukprot:GHRR01011491.1.p1 GENE.GHRR01011491.1~~GHRR01011491.1.p1  ORF type:complete len:553 (+),score=196.54 GHRR01011491.1:156-1814(+)